MAQPPEPENQEKDMKPKRRGHPFLTIQKVREQMG